MTQTPIGEMNQKQLEISDELSDYPILLNTKQFSEITGYSRATAYRLIEEGKIEAKYITIRKDSKPTMRIPRNSLEKWLHKEFKDA